MNNIITAAGLILLHENTQEDHFRVLLLKRNPKLKVHGGNWVFPGGKVDAVDYLAINRAPADIDIKNPPTLIQSDYLKLVKRTALRETLEEAGITQKENSLHYFSRWLTPKAINRRFDTSFFMAEASDINVTVDGSEIIDYQWITPAESLISLKNGEISMPPATFVTLTYLCPFMQIQNAIKTLCKTPIYYRPKLISTDKGLCSLYEDDAGYLNEDYQAKGNLHRLEIINGKFEYIRPHI